ncbi:MAG: LytTR family DNA-binding domain-containing protein [Lachnospiraceae bacterium]|nr:LytTR family DNA-binding domain-containing protein [Lachnospiraceae bacterium]
MNIVICDDQMEERQELYHYLEVYFRQKNIETSFLQCRNQEELFRNVNSDTDIIFLDIFIDQDNGIELARKIRAEYEQVPIVFVSNSADFVFEGYDVEAIGYLLKPVQMEKLEQVLQHFMLKAQRKIKDQEKLILYDSVGKEKTRISYENIEYIESDLKQIIVHTAKLEKVVAYGTLNAIEQAMKDVKCFLRCHQSFLINMDYAKLDTANCVFLMRSSDTVAIRRRHFKEIQKQYFEYIINEE